MQKYTKCKKVLVGNKMRTLYKTSNSNKLYIKHKKKMMSYRNYKKMKSLKTKSFHFSMGKSDKFFREKGAGFGVIFPKAAAVLT